MAEDLPATFSRQALGAVGQAVIVVDLTGSVRYWNRAAEQLYGYRAAEALRRPIVDLIIPAGDRQPATEWGDRIRRGAAHAGDWRVRDRTGRVFTVSVTSTAIRGDDGAVVGSLGVSYDVTHRREAEVRSRQLAAIVDGSDDAIVHIDLHGVIRGANPAVRQIYGYEPVELVGQDITVLTALDGVAQITAAIDRVRAGQSPGLLLTNSRRQDGSPIDVSLRLSPVHDLNGTITGLSGIGRDVTAATRTRARLEASERRFRAQFDHSLVPQAMLTLNGNLQLVNTALCGLLDRSREELRNLDVRLLRHPSDQGPDEAFTAMLAGQRDAGAWERLVCRRDGSAVPVLMQAGVLHEPDGTPSAIAMFLQDLTRLRDAEQTLNRREALFQALAKRASDWAFVLDPTGTVRHASPTMIETFGHPAGSTALSWPNAHPSELATVRDVLRTVSNAPGRSEMVTYRVRDAAGQWRWVEDLLTNHLDNPAVAGVVCNRRDVTERVQVERALRASEARYRAIAETAQEGIWAVDLTAKTLFANAKLAEILGVPLEELYRRRSPDVLAPHDTEFLFDKLRNRLERGTEVYELSYPHPDGRTRLLRISAGPLRDDTGELAAVAMITDVTDIRHAERELRRRTLHDELTGLPNRALLADRLDRALVRRGRNGDGSVATLLIDLDQFKLVNDSWGHTAGDHLLVQVAGRLFTVVRPGDTLARFAGDKFVVVCENTDEPQARTIAAGIHHGLAAPLDVDGQRIHVGASIGIACAPPHTARDLLRYAEAAMYEAKARGRGRTHVFEQGLVDQSNDRMVLRNELREAIDRDGLSLHYQPVVELTTGRILGVEALPRWSHPTRGDIPPEIFVPVAEQTGLAAELDRWALRRAAADARQLRFGMPAGLRLAVNISARHLADPELETAVLAAVRDGCLTAGQLSLEITENAVMENPDQARDALRRLKAVGVDTAMDDFGTGHSSLSHLRKLPIATLKIDRSFIADITTDPDSLAITASIIKLAGVLRLQTIAEGIENAEQLSVLRDLGCPAGQGFLWSPALPPDQLVITLSQLPGRRFPITTGRPAAAPNTAAAAQVADDTAMSAPADRPRG